MPLHVLAASSSAYRRWWYVDQLGAYGMVVATAVDGLDCVEQLRARRPDVLLLESLLRWGGSLGVLAVRADDIDLQEIPVVFLAIEGVSADWYQLAGYSVQDLILRRPSVQKLATTLEAVAQQTCGIASTQ